MKGTLISFDFVKDSSDEIKFLEMNTDVALGEEYSSELDWSGLWTVMSSNSITELDVVYKPFQQDIVDNLSGSASSNGITAFRKHEQDKDEVYPNVPADTGSAFILRLAYDENAIVDSTYTKLGHTSLNLLNEYNSSSLAVPFYYSGSDGLVDTLSAHTSSNASNIPDAVTKTKTHTSLGVNFVKVGDWPGLISESKDNRYITKYEISSASLSNGVVEAIKQYSIAYGANLTPIDVATIKLYGAFGIPTGSQTLVASSSYANIYNAEVDEYWDYFYDHPEVMIEDPNFNYNKTFGVSRYYEYGTTRPKFDTKEYGLFETELILDENGITGSLSNLNSGSSVRSLYIPNFTNVDNWTHAGKTLPAGTVYTSSFAELDSREVPNVTGILSSIKVNGGEAVYSSPSTKVLTYSSASNLFLYDKVANLTATDNYIPGDDGTLLPIEVKTILLHDPTGSHSAADVESVDNYKVYTSGSNIRLIYSNNEFINESPGGKTPFQ